MAELSGPENARIRQLEDQMARLIVTLDEQRAVYEQRLNEQQARMEGQQARLNEQQAEIVGLRDSRPGQRRRADGLHRTGRGASRRALLKWGGAAAAAAAVTLVASEGQATQAAPAADGGNLIIGQANLGTAQTRLAITGTSSASPFFQVDASASTYSSAIAMQGISSAYFGAGVSGTATGTGGIGVGGTSNTGDGVMGTSITGYGVVGSTNRGIELYAGSNGRIQQNLQRWAGAPTIGGYNAGEQIRDRLGDLYLCTVDGSPGTWKKVTAIPAGALGGALVFLHAPFRIFDTRPGVPGCPIDPALPMTSGQITTLQVTGTASTLDSTLVVPAGATGIIGDLLAINNTGVGAGFLTLQPHNVTPTSFSYLHYYPSTIVHNSFVIGLDASGKVDVGNYGAMTNVGMDITGYII